MKPSPKIWDPLRKKEVALTPEERVRQWFIGVLRDSLRVPVHMMMSEVPMKLGDKSFRADILVYRRGGAPLMVVECKNESVALDASVLEQALRYNMVLDVPYIVVTNGRSTFGFERVPTGSGPLAGTPDGAGIPFRQMKSFPDWEKMQGQTAQTP